MSKLRAGAIAEGQDQSRYRWGHRPLFRIAAFGDDRWPVGLANPFAPFDSNSHRRRGTESAPCARHETDELASYRAGFHLSSDIPVSYEAILVLEFRTPSSAGGRCHIRACLRVDRPYHLTLFSITPASNSGVTGGTKP